MVTSCIRKKVTTLFKKIIFLINKMLLKSFAYTKYNNKFLSITSVKTVIIISLETYFGRQIPYTDQSGMIRRTMRA